jgi:iron complex transport system permease protein
MCQAHGAAFGAALAILLFPFSSLIIQLSASFFGLLALFLSYHLAKSFHFGGWILRLILSGIAVGAIFSSALSTIKLLATPGSSLQDITFWMMGGLYNSSWKTAWTILPIMWASLLFFVLLRWRINLFSLDDKITFSLGIAVGKEKTLFLIVATVATTAFISVSGIVGWVGLIIPHLARGVFGSDGRKALPGTLLFGSIFLLISDTLGRTLFSGEIPLGVITSFFGAVIFIGVLSSRQLKVKL